MRKLVIDTNIFFNLEVKTGFGNSPAEISKSFTDLVKKNQGTPQEIELYIPSLVAEELQSFHKQENGFLDNFFSVVRIKSPNIDSLQFPARIFLKLIHEYRENHRLAIRVAEEQLEAAAKESSIGISDQKSLQVKIGPHINKLRERYRHATRWNQIDSVADLELILLAVELDGEIVSADEGLCRWAREFGARQVPANHLAKNLLGLS